MSTSQSAPCQRPRPRWKVALATVASAAVGAFVVAGCGSTSHSRSAQAGGASPTTIKIANEAYIPTYDPVIANSTDDRRLEYLTYGYLTRFPSGAPELAKTLAASHGNTTWTVTLRHGLKFSDGSPLTAKDVVASFTRFLRPPLKGTQEVMDTIRSVTAKGNATVVFRLTHPDASFPQSLTINTAAVFQADKVSSRKFFQSPPVSAGPYRTVSGNLSTGVFRLKADPYYYGSRPRVTAVTMTTAPDGGARLAQVESGQVDYAKNIPANELKNLPANLQINRVTFPAGQVQILMNDGPGSTSMTRSLRIREAINLAVNRQQIANVALDGYMKPLYGMPWADASSRAPAFARNIQEARQLLKGTPCASGCTLKFLNITDFNWQLPPVTAVVQQNLKAIGINLQLVNQPVATLSKLGPSNDWDGFVADPGANLTTETSIAVLSLTNFQWTTVPPTDLPMFPRLATLTQKLAAAPANKRTPVMAEINAAFKNQLPWIPLTTLTFLDVSRLPRSVVSSPIGWYLNIH